MGQHQFKVGDEGMTRGGLRYRVVEIDGSTQPTQPIKSIITTRSGKELPFWHEADGRLNVASHPDFWLVSPTAGFLARIAAWFSRIRRALPTTEAR